jgi:hypothetical protein
MDLSLTGFCLSLSLGVGLAGLLGVRLVPPPGSWRGWIPSHYLLLTGLAGTMCFGIHYLNLIKAA